MKAREGRPGGDSLRLDETPELRRGPAVEITVDGKPVVAYSGETVAAVLMANGLRGFRATARKGEPRGLYCGIGVCYECLVVIDGEPGRRACMTTVRAGMRVQMQAGWGPPPPVRAG